MLNRFSVAAASLLLAASMFAPAYAGVRFADASSSAFCTESADSPYQRPGGFCDQLNDKGSLVKDEDDDEGCSVNVVMNSSDRLLVAGQFDPCDPCQFLGLADDLLFEPADGDRVRVSVC